MRNETAPIQRQYKCEVKIVFVLVQFHFTPILILLFKQSSKCREVQKLVLEKLSYISIFGQIQSFHPPLTKLPYQANNIQQMKRQKKTINYLNFIKTVESHFKYVQR